VTLCHPYDAGITCLCDGNKAVLRCFLSQEESDKVVMKQSHSQHCDRQLDTKTEVILAASISVLVLLILSWTFFSVKRSKRPCTCDHSNCGNRMQEKSTQIKSSFAFEKEQVPVTKMRCYSLDTHLNSSSTYPGTVATSMYPVLNPAIYPQVTGHILSVSNDSDTLSENDQDTRQSGALE